MISLRRSGSRRSPRRVDPTTSANNTVTSLRSSPGRVDSVTGAPHDGQNPTPEGSSAPQAAHASPSEAPQWPQKRASGELSAPHAAQDRMTGVSRGGERVRPQAAGTGGAERLRT